MIMLGGAENWVGNIWRVHGGGGVRGMGWGWVGCG